MTDYALELLANVQKLIIQDGLDPLELSDQYINVSIPPTLNIKLTKIMILFS